ncbi:luciferase family protein [Streptomyces olivoreticuli]|uniref:luciferase domain-containing protein n=1 Tax=Streptomyces olivoreticuli TaxID=68246 RepID=UPI0013C2E2C2|nr:luciferase family protein [Streptomyces olivoreticuli]
MTAAHRAMDRLETWPDLARGTPSCRIGDALRTAESEVVHFHSGREADLHLTRAVLGDLLPVLRQSSAIRPFPGAAWVTVLLECDADVDLLISLVSLALKALVDTWPHPAPQPCNRYRVLLVPGERAPAEAAPPTLAARLGSVRKAVGRRPVPRLRPSA